MINVFPPDKPQTMSSQQFYTSGNLNSFGIRTFNTKEGHGARRKKSAIARRNSVAQNETNTRLRELEELNTHMHDQAEQEKIKLSEVIAGNTKFLSIIAHDLKSPFCSILAGLELLKASLANYNIEEIEKYADYAYNSTNRGIALLDNLLSWAMIQNLKFNNISLVEVNLHKLLCDEIEIIENITRQKNIQVINSIAPYINVNSDAQMVRTILRNLLSNATKFTKPGGKITISAFENIDFIEVEVEDNGVGIPENVQTELFKTNQLFSTKGTNNEQGTGLGLILCKEYTELLGGQLMIWSKPEKGSRFTFTLPL
jgi:two-component system, sensor histidine kinase and response regulator